VRPVRRRLLHPGLSVQLAVAISVVTMLAVSASFLALYEGTAARLRGQIDSQLKAQGEEWRDFERGHSGALEQTAARFLAGQRYHAASLIVFVQLAGGRSVSNDPELVAREEARGGPDSMLHSPPGLATATVAEAGRVRVLSQAIEDGGTRIGTFRIAAPLSSVGEAQSSLLRTFALVGALALLLAVVAGAGLATLISAPLRRIARIAVAVDAGDLSRRAGPMAAGGEIGTLSVAFDRMLERLERSFKRQREFVSDASHELRTPLTVLRAQVELLDRETDERRRHEATGILLGRLDELDRLVGDMLMLASVEGGQLVDSAPIELDDFFEDVRRDLPLYGERDFHVQVLGGTLVADRDRLTQVLRNLVRNAVAHTEPGGRVSLSARPRGDRLVILVADDGPGIPAGELDRIFERFHRLDPGRARDRGGSGLGLAIARALTEAHGGTIRARSAPGEGATFEVELPGYRPRAQGAGISDATSIGSSR
jgi:two-component system, OmpR family, sensor kinase